MTERKRKHEWDGWGRLPGECPGGLAQDLTPTRDALTGRFGAGRGWRRHDFMS